jgi:hypothetical protein
MARELQNHERELQNLQNSRTQNGYRAADVTADFTTVIVS